ncbi:MAG: hypothetical protein FD129_2606, partial [bacterium]
MSSVRLTILGGGREVGASAHL